jgi:hypothetical protein
MMVAALLAAGALVLAACSSGGPSRGTRPCRGRGAAVAVPCASAAVGGVPQFKHVVVAVFENMTYNQVIGNSGAPYFNTLAQGGASFSQSVAEAYPGQPNYLAMFSGDTQGVTDDSCPHTFTTPNLGGDLIAAGLTFTGYAEDPQPFGPGVCNRVPWTDFSNVPAAATQSFTAFPQTSTSNFAALPAVSFVIPTLCHDMSTCAITTGNAWLQNRLSAYAQWALANDSLLIITFAQDNGSGGNHIPTIFYGANVKPGTYSEPINHYNVLRTIEDAYGLPHDGAAATATPITDVWNNTTTSGSPTPTSTSTDTGSPMPPTTSGVPHFRHVVVVLFENKWSGQILGVAPYFTALSKLGANFTQSFALTHPSQPNYLDLFSGSTQGITDDSCPHTFAKPNMAADLSAAGHTFAGYVDSLPSSGATVCTSGTYARKHVPWVDFSNVPSSATRNFTSFPQTAGGNFAGLPDVSYVIPNLCNDMHDCSVATGDAWLKSHLSAYASYALSNDSLLIVTFDEDNGTHGNHIYTVFIGDDVKPGSYGQTINHFSVLRTLEDSYGLPHDGAAASATPITNSWIYDGS